MPRRHEPCPVYCKAVPSLVQGDKRRWRRAASPGRDTTADPELTWMSSVGTLSRKDADTYRVRRSSRRSRQSDGAFPVSHHPPLLSAVTSIVVGSVWTLPITGSLQGLCERLVVLRRRTLKLPTAKTGVNKNYTVYYMGSITRIDGCALRAPLPSLLGISYRRRAAEVIGSPNAPRELGRADKDDQPIVHGSI